MSARVWWSSAVAIAMVLITMPVRAFVVQEPPRNLSAIEAWQCLESRAQGTAYANENLAALGYSCETIFAHERALLVPLFNATNFSTTSPTQQCFLEGYREELAAAMTRMIAQCSEQITRGFVAGKTLGMLACRHAPLNVEAPEFRVAAITFETFDPNGHSLVTKVVHPVRSSQWAGQIISAQLDGFLFGCLLGERDLLLGSPSPYVDDMGRVQWDRLGERVGTVFGQAFCPTQKELERQILDTLAGNSEGAAWSQCERGFSHAYATTCIFEGPR